MNKPNLCLLLILLLLSGCSIFGTKYTKQTDNVDFAAPFQIIDRDSFEEIDLVRLLDPSGASTKDDESGNTRNKLSAGQKIDQAIEHFYQNIAKSSSYEKQAARNRVQERLLAASAQRCGAFKSNLQRAYSRTNFWLGVATTAAGIGGGISSGLYTSKYLSGLAGIFGGTRAEFNQDYYANLTVNVIADGIELKQQEVFRQIQTRGQNLPIEQYPVEAAIKDAVYHHNQCSLVAGLQAASEAIKFSADPGLDGATRIILKTQNLKRAAEGKPLESTIPETIDKLGLVGRIYAGSLLMSRGDAATALTSTIEMEQRTKKMAGEFKVRLGQQIGGFEDAATATNAIPKLLDEKISAVIDNISKCRAPIKTLMEKLTESQAKIPFASSDTEVGLLQAEIQSLNIKAGFATASAQQQYDAMATILRSATAKLGKPEQKIGAAITSDIKKSIDGVTPTNGLCTGII